jgi:hypothetical protein
LTSCLRQQGIDIQPIKPVPNDLPAETKHQITILAAMKNEGDYLQEWIEYHRLIGIEKFYLYDNESDDNTKEILKPYIENGIVDYTYWFGDRQQLKMYDDFLEKYKIGTKWLAVIDLDEFIVLYDDNNILDFLNRFSNEVVQVVVGWQNFGSNKHKIKPDGLVIENYVYRDTGAIQQSSIYGFLDVGKSIVKPIATKRLGAHEHTLMFGTTYKGKYCITGGGGEFNAPISRIQIAINHYQTKSYDEFMSRRIKIGGVGSGKTGWFRDERLRQQFHIKDTNFIYDDFIKEKYAEKLKEAIKKFNEENKNE